MNNQLMIDLETLHLSPCAVILEIGAVPFNIHTGELGQPLHLTLDPWHQIAAGREVCPETIAWHIKQKTQFAGKAKLPDALRQLHHLSFSAEAIWIWGSDFVRPILEDAYQTCNLGSLSWPYWQTRDARTLWKSVFRDQQHAPRQHDALQDCIAAISDLCEAWQHIAPQAESSGKDAMPEL